jgi:tripartite-type tricarboxylate transporter receptor subunit TctC
MFSGKQMTLTIGFIAGGTADADGRTIARYLAAHIPGNPTMIVQNRPGAGGITSINSAFQGGRTERLGIYQLASAHILQQLAGSPSIRFDLRQMPVLGGWLKSTYVLSIRATSGFKTIADIRASKEPPNIGSQGLGTGTYSYTVGWQEALGIKFKLLHGYEGNEQRLAMERGEIDGRTDTASGILERPGWLQRFPALVQNGPEHHPLLPGVPTVYDLTPDPGALWETINNALSVDRPYVCAPGTTAEDMAVVRRAWDDMLKDPALLEEAERRNWRVVPTSYKQIETFYEKVLTNTPAAVVQQLRTIFP